MKNQGAVLVTPYQEGDIRSAIQGGYSRDLRSGGRAVVGKSEGCFSDPGVGPTRELNKLEGFQSVTRTHEGTVSSFPGGDGAAPGLLRERLDPALAGRNYTFLEENSFLHS